jgi:hypothetical protein
MGTLKKAQGNGSSAGSVLRGVAFTARMYRAELRSAKGSVGENAKRNRTSLQERGPRQNALGETGRIGVDHIRS